MINKEMIKLINILERFRLLNSEIGNDQIRKRRVNEKINCFRLLNSEIGNDHFVNVKERERF